MPPAETPTGSAVPRRVLGQYLRELRLEAGLTVKTAARLMEWSEPKMWRIETGQTTMRALDVQAMCAAYGVVPGLTQALAGLAGQTRARGWWRAYGEAIPDDFSIYTALENAACSLAIYAPSLVPGMLRTEAYAHALLANRDAGSVEGDQLVYDCLARRVLLTRASEPLKMTLVLDEALLHRPLGGPAVMAGQLRFLADTAVVPNLCVRVVPSQAWIHPGLATGAFTLLDFPFARHGGDTDTAIIYSEGLTGELYLDKPHEVHRYRDAHAAILRCSLDEASTQDLLLSAAKEFE
jgi:transcriptional regulator with XRE-family HTH domain